MVAPAPWLYLDADGFFASCEEAADPRLHGRAVGVVAGSAYPDAPLIAVNTVAKRAGVRSGDRVRDARERCPGFVVRPQRVERYVKIHERMVCAVGAVLPVAAVHSIDELSAQLSPRDDARSVVDRAKHSVTGALSPLVPVSVGVAPSAWLAKCAAEAHKPSAAVVWHHDNLPAVYADLELEDLPGAGPRICARLRAAGLTTVASIYAASRSRIIVAWGSIEGERVRLALRGADVPARVSRRRSVAHGRVLTARDRCWVSGASSAPSYRGGDRVGWPFFTRRVSRCRNLNEVPPPIGSGRASRARMSLRSVGHAGAGAPKRRLEWCARVSGLRKRVGEVTRRYGISRWQLSTWRSLARQGKLAVASSAQPVVVASEPQLAFATLEVDSATGPGPIGSVVIEARGVTVRLDGDIGASRIAEIASALRRLR